MSKELEPKSPRCEVCGTAFAVPASATHKRFCGGVCRQAWHTARRVTAEAALRAAEAARSAGPKPRNKQKEIV